MRLGIDVGGTNTDAVLVDGRNVVASAKRPTTPDVSSGIVSATLAVIDAAGADASVVESVMIGTTHFANALVERRGLLEVGVLRLAGAAGGALPPMTGWPDDLKRCIGGQVFQLPGGYEFDGREITAFDENAVRHAARKLRVAGLQAVAISCVFAPINRAMEERAAQIVKEENPRCRRDDFQRARAHRVPRTRERDHHECCARAARTARDDLLRHCVCGHGDQRAAVREPERRHADFSRVCRTLSGAHVRFRPDQQHAGRRVPHRHPGCNRDGRGRGRRPISAHW